LITAVAGLISLAWDGTDHLRHTAEWNSAGCRFERSWQLCLQSSGRQGADGGATESVSQIHSDFHR
jgi:hypothetical protein